MISCALSCQVILKNTIPPFCFGSFPVTSSSTCKHLGEIFSSLPLSEEFVFPPSSKEITLNHAQRIKNLKSEKTCKKTYDTGGTIEHYKNLSYIDPALLQEEA